MPGPIPDMVDRVVLRSATDTPAIHLEARSRLGRLQLRAPGSSWHEILIVRSVTHRLRPGPPGPGTEDPGLDEQLGRARREAVPLDGRPVPAEAGAVVAADLAQLLAQYAVDLHDGALPHRWWWRAVVGRLPSAPVGGVLAAYPREAPHVVADLVRRRRLDVLAAERPADLRHLAELVARTYGAGGLAEALGRLHVTPSAVPAPARWDADPTEVIGTTAVEQLVLVATQLAADPTVARSPAFARSVCAAARQSVAAEAPGDSIRTGNPPSSTHPPRAQPGSPGQSAALPTPSASTPSHDDPPPDHHRAPRTLSTPGSAAPTTDAHEVATVSPHPEPTATTPHEGTALADHAVAADASVAGTPAPRGFHTRLGGVFYLVRVIDELGLQDAVVGGEELAETLGPWGILHLIARSLVPTRPDLEADELWDGLEQLGGGPPHERTARRDPEEVRCWVRRVTPVVERLLADRLAVEPADLADTLLLRPARVAWDRTHLDVAFPLAAASVAVRRTGLDRDPGWVPSFTRVIAFHFDDDEYAGGLS